MMTIETGKNIQNFSRPITL